MIVTQEQAQTLEQAGAMVSLRKVITTLAEVGVLVTMYYSEDELAAYRTVCIEQCGYPLIPVATYHGASQAVELYLRALAAARHAAPELAACQRAGIPARLYWEPGAPATLVCSSQPPTTARKAASS